MRQQKQEQALARDLKASAQYPDHMVTSLVLTFTLSQLCYLEMDLSKTYYYHLDFRNIEEDFWSPSLGK